MQEWETVKADVALMRLIRIVIHCEALVVDNLSANSSPVIAAACCVDVYPQNYK